MAESQVVIFELAGVLYGIDIIQVQEIIRTVEITPVAESEMSVEGIINLRGQVIPVICMAGRLGLHPKERDQDTRIVVADLNGKTMGFIVDRVLEVGKFIHEEMEEPSNIGTTVPYLKGIVKKKEKLWLILDLDNVA